MRRNETPPGRQDENPAIRELTPAEMRQVGGGSDPEWRYVTVRR
ncbi:hypothetical protein [Falsiroseomonas sp.]